MLNKITIGLVSVVLVLTLYNTYKLSTLKVEKVIDRGVSTQPVQITPNNQPAANNNMISNPVKANPNPAVNNPLANNNVPTGPTTSIQFKEEVHDFGTVDVNSENNYSFEFKNTGTEPLTISNARGSCGCTVPNWPKEPIMPGETGTIDVIYRPNKGQAGHPQEKTVTVTANTEPSNTIVKIKAMVNPEK